MSIENIIDNHHQEAERAFEDRMKAADERIAAIQAGLVQDEAGHWVKQTEEMK